MLKISLLILLLFSCANISNLDPQDTVCVGEKINEYICYYGSEVNESDCIEYGYGRNKASVQFSYLKDVNCWEFCNYAYENEFECNIINLDD